MSIRTVPNNLAHANGVNGDETAGTTDSGFDRFGTAADNAAGNDLPDFMTDEQQLPLAFPLEPAMSFPSPVSAPISTSLPIVELNGDSSRYNTYYTINGGTPVAIAGPNTLIIDANTSTLVSATITLTNKLDTSDLLEVIGTLPGGITASALVTTATTETLTLTGSASITDYEAALQDVFFNDPGQSPNTTTRGIDVTVTDSLGNTSPTPGPNQYSSGVNFTVPATADWTGADTSAGVTSQSNFLDSLNWSPSGPPVQTANFGVSSYYGTAANPISGYLTSMGTWDFTNTPGGQTYYLEIHDNGGNENHFVNGQGIIGSAVGAVNLTLDGNFFIQNLSTSLNTGLGNAVVTDNSELVINDGSAENAQISVAATQFGGGSDADYASFEVMLANSPPALVFGQDGTFSFSTSSNATASSPLASAGNAQITNNGFTLFDFNSTAANATIDNFNTVVFGGNSHAASSTITNENGGSTYFQFIAYYQTDEFPYGDTAHIINLAGSYLDISGMSDGTNSFGIPTGNGLNPSNPNFISTGNPAFAGLSLGAVEGAGHVYLGDNNLIVGGLDTVATTVREISGIISDGGAAVNSPTTFSPGSTASGLGDQGANQTGGLLTKTGAGILELSNTNTYTGGTIIDAGTLDLNAVGAAGGSNDVTFDAVAGTKTLGLETTALTAGSFANQIDGLALGDAIDLETIGAATGLSYNAGTHILTVTGGSGGPDTLTLAAGTYGGFTLSTDAAGTGTDVSLAPDILSFITDTGAPGFTKNTSVTLSGSALPGSSVTIYDGATNVGQAAADGTTGLWSFDTSTASVPAEHTLSNGSHVFKATETLALQTSLLSLPFDVTVDTVAPAVSVAATPASFDGTSATVLTGTASDTGSGVAGVELFNGATDLGAASYDAVHGTWSFSATLAAGNYTALHAVATDNAGNATTYNAHFELFTGVTGQAFTAYEDDFDGGGHLTAIKVFDYSGEPFTSLEADYDIAGNLTTVKGFGFTNGLYTSDEVDYNSSGAVTGVTYSNGASVYLSESVHAISGGGTAYVGTGGTYFAGQPFTGFEDDYDSGGHLTAIKVSGFTREPFTSLEADYDNSGNLTAAKGFGFTNGLYTSDEVDYNSAGAVTGVTYFDGSVGGVYLSESVHSITGGGTAYDGTSGDYFTGKSFSSFEADYLANGSLASATYNNNDGSHSIVPGQSGVTLTGAGANDFFYLNNQGFGQDTIANFAAMGATHDTLVLPSADFADIATVLADTNDSGMNAVITAMNGDQVTLDNVSRATLVANQQDLHLA